MTQHQEYKAKQRNNDYKGLTIAKMQEINKDYVGMKLPNQKCIYLVERKRVELRLSQGYELA